VIAVLLALAALALVLTVGAVLLAVTGRRLVHADHDLPEPARYARCGPTPKEPR
jgi:hypothetical protein